MEFFKIWIVNSALSLLTLGFYAPWAKVRTKRYFYANTFLDGANFEYHAKPVSILIARIIVIFIVFGGSLLLSPELYGDEFGLSYTFLLFLFLPWSWVRGLSFNARNSSHRNIRFSFRRAYALPYLLGGLLLSGGGFLLYLLGGLLLNGGEFLLSLPQHLYGLFLSGVLFLLLPWLIRYYQKFKAERHQFGHISFSFNHVSAWSYIRIYGYILFYFLTLALLTALSYFQMLAPLAAPGSGPETDAFYAAAFLLLGVFLITRAQAAYSRLFWDNVRAENGVAFHCNFSIAAFSTILLVNFFATILSLGLLTPWAKVRKIKFLTDNITFTAPAGFMDSIAARRDADESAFGEEFDTAEGFDFDVGIF